MSKEIHYQQGMELFAEDRLDQAIEELTKALEYDSDYGDALHAFNTVALALLNRTLAQLSTWLTPVVVVGGHDGFGIHHYSLDTGIGTEPEADLLAHKATEQVSEASEHNHRAPGIRVDIQAEVALP